MSAAEVFNIADHMKITTKLVCSGCGAPGEGSCNCGVAYVSQGKRAEAAVKADPDKTDREIAAKSGIPRPTISRARNRIGSNEPIQQRKAKGGRSYPSKRKAPIPPAPPIKTPDVKGRVAGVDIKVDPSLWQAFNEIAQRKQKSATALIGELITSVIEPGGVDLRADLPKSAQEKLDAAMRQHRRKLDAEYDERKRNLNEEVRQRVLKEGKEYLATLREMEVKAREKEEWYREMSERLKHPFTIEQFKLIRMCLHPDGERTVEKLAEAFRLFNDRKQPLTGEK